MFYLANLISIPGYRGYITTEATEKRIKSRGIGAIILMPQYG